MLYSTTKIWKGELTTMADKMSINLTSTSPVEKKKRAPRNNPNSPEVLAAAAQGDFSNYKVASSMDITLPYIRWFHNNKATAEEQAFIKGLLVDKDGNVAGFQSIKSAFFGKFYPAAPKAKKPGSISVDSLIAEWGLK